MLSAPRPVGVSVRVKKNQQANIEYKSAEKVLISYEIRTLLEGVDTLDATIKIQTQEEGFSKSSLNLM